MKVLPKVIKTCGECPYFSYTNIQQADAYCKLQVTMTSGYLGNMYSYWEPPPNCPLQEAKDEPK